MLLEDNEAESVLFFCLRLGLDRATEDEFSKTAESAAESVAETERLGSETEAEATTRRLVLEEGAEPGEAAMSRSGPLPALLRFGRAMICDVMDCLVCE